MIIRNKIFPIAALGSALTLTGCITPSEMQARHAATCASFGFAPGSEGYAFCMMQLDLADHGYSHHGVGQRYWPYPPPPYGAQQVPPSRPPDSQQVPPSPPPPDSQQIPPKGLR